MKNKNIYGVRSFVQSDSDETVTEQELIEAGLNSEETESDIEDCDLTLEGVVE